MANYTKLTDFASKDSLPTGTPAKIVKGTEIDDEFQAIETSISTKANSSSPALTGVPTAPTAAAATSTTQIATTAMVQAAIGQDNIISEDQLNGLGTGAEGQVITSDGATGFVWGYGVPSGAVMSFAMSSIPSGWLKCNGALVSRTTYANLFSAIGTTYGAGDGSTTFQLPELRGEFIRGWDDSRGIDPGRVFGGFQDEEIQSHTHDLTQDATDEAGFQSTEGYWSRSSSLLASMTNTTTATGGDETRPRNIALMYCIKV
jgi:microcystin-dependent protein